MAVDDIAGRPASVRQRAVFSRELVMLHKLFTVAMLGVVLSTGLLLAGCKSDNAAQSSYGLTGSTDDNAAFNPRYYDAKGHYRSDWVGQK
jgi:hypothetical protein